MPAKMTDEEITILRREARKVWEGLAPDYGEGDPDDAVQPVVDELVSVLVFEKSRDKHRNLIALLRGYDKEACKIVRQAIVA